MSTSAPDLITLLNPIGVRQSARFPLARRLGSIRGESIGFIDKIKANAGLFLSYIEHMIREAICVTSSRAK